MSDARSALIEPVFAAWRARRIGPGTAARVHDLRWEADGTTQQVHDLLRDKTRRAHDRSAEPTAAVVDAQSVKTSANVAETSQRIDDDLPVVHAWSACRGPPVSAGRVTPIPHL
ncbi:hypothetical protein [Streptomyces diastatochromogenes]|uniref:hypothetical protein n=1 Tax=Streptomyces diastatochromogenes TaxID=42236 RepID=UPI0036B21E9F